MKFLSNGVQKFVQFKLLLLLRCQHQSSSDGDHQSLTWGKYFTDIRGQISRMTDVLNWKYQKYQTKIKINHLIRRKEWNQRAIIVDLRHFFNCNIEAWRFSTFTYLASTLGMSPCLVLTELSVFVTSRNCISWCPPIHLSMQVDLMEGLRLDVGSQRRRSGKIKAFPSFRIA